MTARNLPKVVQLKVETASMGSFCAILERMSSHIMSIYEVKMLSCSRSLVTVSIQGHILQSDNLLPLGLKRHATASSFALHEHRPVRRESTRFRRDQHGAFVAVDGPACACRYLSRPFRRRTKAHSGQCERPPHILRVVFSGEYVFGHEPCSNHDSRLSHQLTTVLGICGVDGKRGCTRHRLPYKSSPEKRLTPILVGGVKTLLNLPVQGK
jgi:hypothetical protein